MLLLCFFFSVSAGKVVDLESSLSQIQLSPPVTRQQQTALLYCPNNSTTHTFLACDVKNACWGEVYSASYSCSAPLSPHPPMMTCSNGVQHVPYTLVCDHRPDCGDGSDEDFCVFPGCDITASEQFDCGNAQVSLSLSFTLTLLLFEQHNHCPCPLTQCSR